MTDIRDICNLNGISCRNQTGGYLQPSELQAKLDKKKNETGILTGGAIMIKAFSSSEAAMSHLNDPKNGVESIISIQTHRDTEPGEIHRKGVQSVDVTYNISDQLFEELKRKQR
jgi:hypothetical protein